MEFALVVIILIGLVAAVFQFGTGLVEVQTLTGAAREGARYAAVRHTVSESTARVTDATTPFLPDQTPVVKVGSTTYAAATKPCDIAANHGLPVEVSWTQTLDISIVSFTFAPQVNIKGTFRCE